MVVTLCHLRSAFPVCLSSLPFQSALPVSFSSLPFQSAFPVSLPFQSAFPVSLPFQSVCLSSLPFQSAARPPSDITPHAYTFCIYCHLSSGPVCSDCYVMLQVHVVASMPCYSPTNVDQQRGHGVFDRSIKGLQVLNAVGYGQPGTGLQLDLVYNPNGIFLAPAQSKLEVRLSRPGALVRPALHPPCSSLGSPSQACPSSPFQPTQEVHPHDQLKCLYLGICASRSFFVSAVK